MSRRTALVIVLVSFYFSNLATFGNSKSVGAKFTCSFRGTIRKVNVHSSSCRINKIQGERYLILKIPFWGYTIDMELQGVENPQKGIFTLTVMHDIANKWRRYRTKIKKKPYKIYNKFSRKYRLNIKKIVFSRNNYYSIPISGTFFWHSLNEANPDFRGHHKVCFACNCPGN